MRFRAGDLRPHGWRRRRPSTFPTGATEYVPVPADDGWWDLVPIWEPDQTVNPLRRHGPPETTLTS
jgi:hypothetical protein